MRRGSRSARRLHVANCSGVPILAVALFLALAADAQRSCGTASSGCSTPDSCCWYACTSADAIGGYNSWSAGSSWPGEAPHPEGNWALDGVFGAIQSGWPNSAPADVQPTCDSFRGGSCYCWNTPLPTVSPTAADECTGNFRPVERCTMGDGPGGKCSYYYRVRGAGTDIVNGYYQYCCWNDGRPQFLKVHPSPVDLDGNTIGIWFSGGFGWRDGTHNSVWVLLIRGNATMSWYDGLYYSDPADNQDSNSFVPAATGWRSCADHSRNCGQLSGTHGEGVAPWPIVEAVNCLPTHGPTASPVMTTSPPSAGPSQTPSGYPTTPEPTANPTTSEPTTSAPTANPTTSEPSTSEPTMNPASAEPTATPISSEPSDVPSAQPTASPTITPTIGRPTRTNRTAERGASEQHSHSEMTVVVVIMAVVIAILVIVVVAMWISRPGADKGSDPGHGAEVVQPISQRSIMTNPVYDVNANSGYAEIPALVPPALAPTAAVANVYEEDDLTSSL